MLTRSHVELIEIPQRMGAVRKNAADIKLSVDALEMAFERDYVTTFVICTGDSDFTPLVHKLRELNKRVIGVGIKDSTSALLPPACDEFLFYDTLEGVDAPVGPAEAQAVGRAGRRSEPEPVRAGAGGRATGDAREARQRRRTRPSRSRRRSPGSNARRAGRFSPRRSSARCCARTPRSARPTTASARSASCCATSPIATSSSSARARRRAIPRSRSRPTAARGMRSTCCRRS